MISIMSPSSAIISDLDQVSHPIFLKWNDSAQIEQRCNGGKDIHLSTSDYAKIQSYNKRKATEEIDFASARSCRGNSNAKDVMNHYLNEREEMILMKTQHLVKEYRSTLLKPRTNPKLPADSTLAADLSGWAVSLSGDGTRLVVGARDNDGSDGKDNSGHVRVFKNGVQ